MIKRYCIVLMVSCFVVFFTSSCTSMGNGGFGSEIMRREGMAASRILASPLNMIGFSYAEIKEHAPTSVVLSPLVLCYTIPAGAVAMCKDILVGFAEMFTGQQFESVMYPWDSFDIDETKEWRDYSRGVCIALGLVALEATIDTLRNRDSGPGPGPSPGPGSSSGEYSGSGRISGPSTLLTGKTGVYYLYIGGKKVRDDNVVWRQQGTCITVSDNGHYARVMGGLPPGKRTTTRLEAKYNGRTFSKSITVRR